jgi:hypothetical protein
MKKDKEKWINDSYESINGVNRAMPGEFVFPKILNRLKHTAKENMYISRRKAAIGFITILLLAALNAGAILIKNNSTSINNDTDTIVKEYFPSYENNLEQFFNN